MTSILQVFIKKIDTKSIFDLHFFKKAILKVKGSTIRCIDG